MRHYHELLAGLMLVAMTAEMAPGADGAEQCGIPGYVLNLRCRDGAACDLDRRCDGTCLVAAFYRASDRLTSEGEPGCYVDARLRTRPPRGRAWLQVWPTGATVYTPVRTGPADTWDGLAPARLRYKCRPARRSCVPPLAEGSVSISGYYFPELSHFSARAYAARPFGGLPDPYFHLFVIGDNAEPTQWLRVRVGSALTTGSFPSVQLGFAELQVQAPLVVERELIDAELTISAIEPSDNDVSVVHGTFKGTFIHENGSTPVVVDASF